MATASDPEEIPRLYGALNERILAKDKDGTIQVYYELLRLGRPLSEIMARTAQAAAGWRQALGFCSCSRARKRPPLTALPPARLRWTPEREQSQTRRGAIRRPGRLRRPNRFPHRPRPLRQRLRRSLRQTCSRRL